MLGFSIIPLLLSSQAPFTYCLIPEPSVLQEKAHTNLTHTHFHMHHTQFGPRVLQSMLMLWGGVMILIAAVAVRDATSLIVMRFLIGVVGE